MHEDSILLFSRIHGFGELFWFTCPSCWNSMRSVHWEDGETEERCTVCERMDARN